MHDNPFKYGTVVTGNDFVNRPDELKIMTRELAAGKSIVLFSQRRVGKTSLIMEFMRRKKNKFSSVFIDLYGMTTKEELANKIELLDSYMYSLEGLRNKLVELCEKEPEQ